MSLKYLNWTGLTNLVTDIKNWVIARIPTKTSEITNDSGFITSNSLPTNYVTTDTTQTIPGQKTFTTDTYITSDSKKYLQIKNTSWDLGQATSTSDLEFGGICFKDKDNQNTSFIITYEWASGYGGLRLLYRTKFSNGAKSTSGSNVDSQFTIGVTPDGKAYCGTNGYWHTNLIPTVNNNITLGNATYRWKAIYANSYYLGTTAFGDIVTHNASEFLTSHQSLSNYVTTDTEQTVTGNKVYGGTLLKFNNYNWVIRYRTQGTSNFPNYDLFKQIEYSRYNNIVTLRRSTDVYGSTDFNTVDTSFAFYKIHTNAKYIDLVDNTRFINNGTTNAVYPITTNVTSLGTSSLAWKSVYSNSYYLGTTAFGDIVTHNASEFLTSHQSLSDYVTLNTQQNISANKFFYGGAWRVGSNYPSFICKNNTHTVGEAAPSSMWGYGEFLIQDKNDYSVGLLSCRYDQNATQYFRIESRNKFTNGAPNVNGTAASSVLDVGTLSNGTPYVYWNSYISNALVPRLAFTWDIGSYANPWNIVYAANYKIKSANTVLGVTPSNSTVDFIELLDANNAQTGYIGRWQHSNGYSCINLTCYDKYDGAGNRSTSGTVANGTLEIGVSNTGVPYLNYNTYFMQNISPLTNDDKDLGDASHHWRNLFIGEVHCYHQNAIMMKQGSYTFLLRNDGSYLWFLISAANGNEGTWNDLRPLYINCADGSCSTTSRWSFNKSFGDGDPSILIQSGTAYANGTWNYPLSALAPNMQAGSNLFMPIGRSHSTGNCAGWHFYYAGNNSNDNFLSVEFYAVGSPLSVYRDGRVFLSATPATSDNSTRVATTAYVKNQGYLSGTVPIANGGTGSTTRLGAVQNLTNEHVGTSTQYFLTITQNWGKAGYCSVADAKTVLGIGTTSKKLTSIGERETEGTWTLTCTTLAPIYFKIVASKTSSTAEFVCGLSSTSSCRFVTDSNSYNSTQIVYTVVRTGSSGEAMWGIGIPTSTSSSVTVFIRNSQYMQTFKVTAYQ